MTLHRRFFLFFLVAIFLPVVVLPQVRSDYQVYQAFDQESKAIKAGIEAATTVVECVDLDSRIMDMELEYKPYEAMLDNAVYPDGFAGTLRNLRTELALTKAKLNVIENQFARISELESQVRVLTDRVEELSGQSAELLEELQRLRRSGELDSLRQVVRQLRAGLRQRDELIFSLVDSLFLQYDKDVAMLDDMEKQGIAARLERKNVFTNIRQTLEDNVRFVESTTLRGEDLQQIRAERKSFQSRWSGLGPKLAAIYGGSKSRRAQELADVDTLLERWQGGVQSAIWRGLNNLFTEKEVEVAPFSTGSEFYANVMTYLEREIRLAEEAQEGGRYMRYVSFADSLWEAHMEPVWIPMLVEEDLLSEEQVRLIQERIDQWGELVSPPATLTYTIIILLIVIVVVYLYSRYRKVKEKPLPES